MTTNRSENSKPSMDPESLLLALTKRFHRYLNDSVVLIAGYVESDPMEDDPGLVYSINHQWHETGLPVNLALNKALDGFVDLYESGADCGEREEAFYELMHQFREQLKADYQQLRELIGDYDSLLTTEGSIQPDIDAAFQAQYEPNEPLSLSELAELLDQTKQSLTEASETSKSEPSDSDNVTHFGDHLAMREFFEK